MRSITVLIFKTLLFLTISLPVEAVERIPWWDSTDYIAKDWFIEGETDYHSFELMVAVAGRIYRNDEDTFRKIKQALPELFARFPVFFEFIL